MATPDQSEAAVSPEVAARALKPSLVERVLTADECGCLHGNRGGAQYRALARLGITWPGVGYLLTPHGRAVVAILATAAGVPLRCPSNEARK